MSTKATSGVRSETRRTASAVVAAGPTTSAPHDSSSIFNPVPTSQESSTMRIHRPLRTEEPISGGSQTGCEVMRYRAGVWGRSHSVALHLWRRNPRERGRALGPLQDRKDVRYGTLKSRYANVLGSISVTRRAAVTTEPENEPNM